MENVTVEVKMIAAGRKMPQLSLIQKGRRIQATWLVTLTLTVHGRPWMTRLSYKNHLQELREDIRRAHRR